MKTRSEQPLNIVLWIGAVGLLCSLGLLFFLDTSATSKPATIPNTDTPKRIEEPVKPVLAPVPTKAKTEPPKPRRLPVAGSTGVFVVIEPDGSSYWEDSSGVRQQLLSQPETQLPVKQEAKPPQPAVMGQLVVLETGVVDVPLDAVITFIGRDKLVTHQPDGTSVTYHVNGKIEKRDRPRGLSDAKK